VAVVLVLDLFMLDTLVLCIATTATTSAPSCE